MPEYHQRLATYGYATVALFAFSRISDAGIVFDQTFDDNGSVASYVSATPNSGQFNDISADGTLNNVTVTGGQLMFDIDPDTNGSTEPNANSGLLRSTELTSPVPTLLSMQLTLTYSRDVATSNYGPGPAIQVGDFPASATSYGGTVAADRFDDILFRRGGLSAYSIELSGTDKGTASFGDEIVLTYFLNDSGLPANFVGPDNAPYVLNNDSVALFVGTTLIANNHAATNGASSDLSTFRIVAMDAADTTLSINRILVRDDLAIVPEPVSVGLLGVTGAIAMRRHRPRRGRAEG